MIEKIKSKLAPYFKSVELYLFSFFAILIFMAYIYIRFVRPRLPKDIPFVLNEFYFYIFLWICILYIYIIYRTLKPKIPSEVILNILKKVTYPFSYVQSKIIFKDFFILLKGFSLEKEDFIYLCLIIIPKVFLLIIFIVDIFILHKIPIFYYLLILNLIPFICSYFILQIKNGKEIVIINVEARYSYVKLQEEDNDIPDYIWNRLIDTYGRENYEKLSYEEKVLVYYDEDSSYEIARHNPYAIHYDRWEVPIREYFDIMHERMQNQWDKTKLSHQYDYVPTPTCQHNIYEEYKKTHTLTKLEAKDYALLNKDFFIFKDILFNIFVVLDDIEYFEKKYRYIFFNIILLDIFLEY